MYAHIYTFGCKVNQAESEKIVNELKFYNLEHTQDPDEAQIIIFNTCAVTERAEKKFRAMMKKMKEANPEVLIAVTGCAAEKEKERLKDMGADIVVTNSGKMEVLKHIASRTDHLESIFDFSGFTEADNPEMATRTRAFIKIQDGCDSGCAYCIIPSLRGRPVSRALDSVLNEVSNLVANGYREIVPVGIHVGKYGQDLPDETDLASLVESIISLEGDFRVRLTSLEVNELSERMVGLLAANQRKICRHYHIPLQSGSTQILKKMNRKYDAHEYISKVNAIKLKVPDCMIGADVIVGFPGETDENFNETVETILAAGIEHLHVFSYSDRSGTEASEMPDKVPNKVKQERAGRLRELAKELKQRAAERCVGKTLRTLAQKDNTGITDNYFTVRLKEGVEPGVFLDVLITDVYKDGTLKGDVV